MEMVEVKTTELVGKSLDWAVACSINGSKEFFEVFGARLLGRSITAEVADGNIRPSTDWAQCGPLIEKYQLEIVQPFSGGDWMAIKSWDYTANEYYPSGKTHLAAACRSIVHAKLGETVLVPKELIS